MFMDFLGFLHVLQYKIVHRKYIDLVLIMYVGKLAVRGYFGQNTIEAAKEPRTLPHDVCTRSYGKIAGCVYHSPIRRSRILIRFEIITFYHQREIITLFL